MKLIREALHYQSSGDDVKLLQQILLKLGFNPAVVADGNWGDETEKAVRAFQKKCKITEVGLGPQTRAALSKRTGIDLDSLTSLAEGERLVAKITRRSKTSKK